MPQDRVKMLSDKLKARLQPYVDGNKADFRISAKDEAARLADHAFGAPILHVIGCAGRGDSGCMLHNSLHTIWFRVSVFANARRSSL